MAFLRNNSEKSLAFDQSLFDLFESEFGRPLSQMELQRMADWLKDYEQKLICYALREALTPTITKALIT